MHLAILPLPPLLPRPLRPLAVLHCCAAATSAEPRLPQGMPLQSQQQPPPGRLLLRWWDNFLLTARRRGCLLHSRWSHIGALLLGGCFAADLISAACTAAVGGCLLFQLHMQRIKPLAHGRCHVKDRQVRTVACNS